MISTHEATATVYQCDYPRCGAEDVAFWTNHNYTGTHPGTDWKRVYLGDKPTEGILEDDSNDWYILCPTHAEQQELLNVIVDLFGRLNK